MAVKVIDWPEFMVGVDGVIAPATRAELRVTAALFMLFTVVGVEALSVSIMFATTVFPTSALGNAHANELDVPDIPVYNAFASCVPVMLLTAIQFAV